MQRTETNSFRLILLLAQNFVSFVTLKENVTDVNQLVAICCFQPLGAEVLERTSLTTHAIEVGRSINRETFQFLPDDVSGKYRRVVRNLVSIGHKSSASSP